MKKLGKLFFVSVIAVFCLAGLDSVRAQQKSGGAKQRKCYSSKLKKYVPCAAKNRQRKSSSTAGSQSSKDLVTADRINSGSAVVGDLPKDQGSGVGRGTGRGAGIGTGSGTGDGHGIGSGKGSGVGTGVGSETKPAEACANGKTTTPLKILSKPRPEMTEEARRANVQGVVRLRVMFASDGTIKDIAPLSGLPYGLTESAIKAAKEMKFTPAQKCGTPLSVSRVVEYSFNVY